MSVTWPWIGLFLITVIGYVIWARRERKGLRILMYHKLDTEKSDFLTVRNEEFERQIQWLIASGFHFISFSDLEEKKRLGIPLPVRSVILTFDDGYQNNHDLLLPVLKKYHLKASIFLPIGFVGMHNEWDRGSDVLMDWDTLESAKGYFEYGIHSYSHRNMAEMSVDDFKADLERCINDVKKRQLDYIPVLAYPYGKFVRRAKSRKAYDRVLNELGFSFALRIGNTINRYPFKNRFLLCRIDIRGTDSIDDFRSKVLKGRLKIF